MASGAATLCLLGIALAACSEDGRSISLPAPNPCFTEPGHEKPFVHFGPDVSAQMLCGEKRDVVVATISNLGSGNIRWSASSDGEPSIFKLKTPAGNACPGMQASVVTLGLTPSLLVATGQPLEATVTIRADEDEFPPGTVKVRIVIVPPSVATDHAVVDFFDVKPGTMIQKYIGLTNTNHVPVWIEALPPTPNIAIQGGSLRLDPGQTQHWFVVLSAPDTVGDYSADAVWRVVAGGGPLEGPCAGTTTVKVKARVGAIADAGSD